MTIESDTKNSMEPYIPRWLKCLVCLSVLIAILSFFLYLVEFGFSRSSDHAVWGQFGDFIGGTLNPLFALTALFALLHTIRLQSRELRYSAEQLKDSASALKKQHGVLKKQNFEETFFQLLKLFNETTENIELKRSKSENYKGRGVIKWIFEYFVNLPNVLTSEEEAEYTDQRTILSDEFTELYKIYGHLIGHYYRTLYIIIEFIDESDLDEQEKQRYAKIFRAQLSKYELGLLIYDCISDLGKEKLLPLVKKYNLLKHLEESILQSDEHLTIFNMMS